MQRLDRLLAIFIQLQSRRLLRAQEIADRYHITIRTVYRDIRSLQEAGLPVIGEAGIGYSVMEGYKLAPGMFTREEATAFLTGEKLISSLADAQTRNSYLQGMDKIRSIIGTVDKDYLEQIDHRVDVPKGRVVNDLPLAQNQLQTILNAVVARKVLQIDYHSPFQQESQKILIEPAGVFFINNYWHLNAWCRIRLAYLDFRFDQIRSITFTEETYETLHPSLKNSQNKQHPAYPY